MRNGAIEAGERKLRVAFITPYKTGNVGTALQAYATQALIERAGCEARVIDYFWKQIENPFCLENLKRRGLATYLAAIAGYLLRLPKQRGYMAFVSRIARTRRVEKKALSALQDEYDLFLAGSDCIWNADAFGVETAFFLDFVSDPARMGNYASSFAMMEPPRQYRALYEKLLSRFPSLSVRESYALPLVKSLTGKDATLVLDPTLTLDASFWHTVANESRIRIKEKYLFVAEYSRSARLWHDAETLAKQNGWRIVCAYPPKGKPFAKAKLYMRAAPQDFLHLIRNAEMVLTDSYHMTIFALNFNRPFLTYVTGIAEATKSKYESVLSLLGVEGRLSLDSANRREAFALSSIPPIDFTRVNEALKREREKSVSYLDALLERAKTELLP